ncbi:MULTISPECIES: class I SAM-dependent methyltransferase [unclassified Lysobacter]|uniref:class I SAM-dependent methyltransferase n=1 Tax=unclassified Lysobacter TaxID=2635362 RepID=UPI001BE73CB5|nr:MULTISPECIES: class I SAM-dependent methyltransferase [unclassified Lysobacter]MBT2744817.1 methyltransferase domain-containing protein [Lysobacter sp. ISL-42]MBT2752190.1 methyltransferase domain-containing protein [Lysobacter sp. ISL-50]MBT2778687.1 methyltransferase domain-containing protein [Lysobacter sp. ISL-54]MBT2780382.1 methyltransferase domain-containing protein [Lysobacter sp. ISL-52]
MIDYDLELRHHNDVLRIAYAIRASDRVVDVGCGTGQTTRDAARLATAGTVLGIDRSAEMIERARALTSAAHIGNVEYVCANAEEQELPRERFDVAISRFGTMFFSRPVAAFAQLRSALRAQGRLVMMVWQSRDRNEWATSIERALASDEASASAEPQAFSLGATDVAERILDSAGFLAPRFEEVRAPVFYGRDVDAAFEFVSEFSTVRERIAGLDSGPRAHAVDRLRDLLARHQAADGVWFDSRAWIVTAHRE